MLKDLSEFTPPGEDEITLCEIDGRTHTANYKLNNINKITSVVDKHPQIVIYKDMLQSKSDELKEIFLPVEVPVLKHLVQIYYEHGFIEMLQNAARQRQYLISKAASVLLKCVGTINELRSLVNPHIKKDTRSLISNVIRTRNWCSTPIKCISWHPYVKKIAVATFDDNVKIFYYGVNTVTVLKIKRQKNITCMAWRPMCVSDLAVGCEDCIIIWNIDPSSIVARPSSSCATCLYKFEHRPVLSLTWSPFGEVLVSAAACDSRIQIWDVEMNRNCQLKRHGAGNTIVEYSSKGSKLFSCSNGVIFRVWDTRNWESERWNLLMGRVQAACWLPCNTVLLFTTNEEPLIYSVSLMETDLIYANNTSNASDKAIPLYDLSKKEINGNILGGIVRNMVVDPKGKHLAVLFQDTNYICLFGIIMQPTLQLSASCLIAGMPEEIPNVLDFQKNFEDGACLSIGWSSGRLQHFPIVYTDLGGCDATHQSFYTSFTSKSEFI